MTDVGSPRLSVVVATYNRGPSLVRLFELIAAQQVSADFEVVLVDDGSTQPAAPLVEHQSWPFPLTTLRQDNTGQAIARQRGVDRATGEIIVILDDDMEVPPDFLAAHLEAHDGGARVGLGYIAPPKDTGSLSLFERFHIHQIQQFVAAMRRGVAPRGVHLCTGNVSFRREDFLEVGGFDESLARSEDRELGVRLEKHGAKLAFVERAKSLHNSDHDDPAAWLRRACLYGVYDRRISEKHDDVETADPWRFLFLTSPLSRPLLVTAVVAPLLTRPLEHIGLAVSHAVDSAGAERVAIAGTTLVYGLAYFRGIREDTGSLSGAARDALHYLAKRAASDAAGPLLRFAHAVREDYASVQRNRAKYHDDEIPLSRLPLHLLTKIGFQMTTATRLMHLARDAHVPVAPQVISRFIRHAYAAEIHWDAQIAPGLSIVHGNGLVLSHRAVIEEGCILFHNVTLGEGIDPETREVGAPHLERDVHVGPGAVLLGPITVGRGSKIAAGAVLSRSVPPDSIVQPGDARVEVSARTGKGPGRQASALRRTRRPGGARGGVS